MIGWGICHIFLARNLFAAGETWAWNCIAIAMTSWFVVDTSLSLYYGATFNAGFNVIFYLLFVAPLFFTRKQFFH